MRKEELLKVYAYAGAIWSSFKIPQSELEAKLMDEVWFMQLEPYKLSIILSAVNEYARENSFCNIVQIADICRRFKEISEGTYIDEEKLLQEISNAVSWDKCKENFEKLSPLAKTIVGGSWMLARWSRDDGFNSVIKSNLRKQIHNTLENMRMEKTVTQLKINTTISHNQKSILLDINKEQRKNEENK